MQHLNFLCPHRYTQISGKVGKKQEIRGNRTRVAGLSDIIRRLGGGESSWREAQRKESLDKILNKGKGKRGVGLEDNEEEEASRISKRRRGDPTAFKSKRMRPNAANTFRQDIAV